MPGGHIEAFPDNGDLGPLKIPKTLQTLMDAEKAIAFLMDRGGFWSGNKEQFAYAMDWTRRTGEADRARVEAACTLTREQEHLPPHVGKTLADFVVAYSPSQGGMTLVDPASGDMPLHHYVHILAGDVARQRQHKTENRRRLPTWKKAGQAAANGDDHEMARLCWQAEHEISTTGFVSDATHAELFKIFVSRGFEG